MNALDIAILVAGGLGVISGLGRGLLRMAVSIVALAGGVYLAYLYYPAVRDLAMRYVSMSPTVGAVVGYAIVFFIVVMIVQSAGAVLMRLVITISLGWFDRLLGGVAGGAITLAMIGLVLMLMTAALPADTALIKHSQLAPPVLHYTNALLAYIPPEVKTQYENKRNQLMRDWAGQALEGKLPPSGRATP